MDLGSTIWGLQQPGISEANPFLGPKPSATKLALIKGAGTAGQALLYELLSKKHPKLAGVLGIAGGGVSGAIGARNIAVARKAGKK